MPDPTTGDEPIDKALAWVENKLRTLAIRAELLAEVRDELIRDTGQRRLSPEPLAPGREDRA